jgi:hypothetical protein
MKDAESKFTDQRLCEQLVWRMRLADLDRGTNRTILNRTFNGDPPFDKATAEENNVEVNRNFLEGTGNLTDARTQWNSNFLKPGDIFTVRLDSGPVQKRTEWSMEITKHLNRALKGSLGMINQARETGAGVLLHGIGPATWQDRRSPIPKVIPLSSLMIPSETDIDFENLEYFAIFREMTPSQLYEKTHGPKVDPGWNMDLVKSELKYVGEQTVKQPNATAFQFMPERVEELIKQDMGFWGSDAVPTIDYWDFYFREKENGTGWYRRIFLDWSSSGRTATTGQEMPESPNGGQWLYSSGKRKYADSWQEILHCNYGDCSCVAPFKFHSVRSLGWMIWGIVDIQNRLQCKITEQAFSDLMWFFRVASQNDFNRIKKANFMQMGVIPQGVDWVMPNQRYSPNPTFIELVIAQNRQLMSQHSSSYTRNAERTDMNKEKTATQVMAEVNSVNTMVSGVMNMAYTYEAFKYREIARRFCIPNNPDALVRKFRKGCLDDGVPSEYLDVDRWDIEPDRAMGAGNKTVQMAIVQYLQSIRQNLGPEAQRKVDHHGILIMTEDAGIAEDLAPIRGQKQVSKSAHDAELSTERLMRGLPFSPTPEMVYEDYVLVWMRDMGIIIQQIQGTDNMGTQEQLAGLGNMAQHIGAFLQIMGQNPADKPKVRQYSDLLGQMMNVIKGFAQRLQEQQASGNGQPGAGGPDPDTIVKLQGKALMDQAKAQNMRESHAERTAQKQVSFEMEQQRKDKQTEAEIQRKNVTFQQELAAEQARTMQELSQPQPKPPTETTE